MTDKTTKKTVVKASAGKQVKAGTGKAAGVEAAVAAAPKAVAPKAAEPKATAAPKAKASPEKVAAAQAASPVATAKDSLVPADVVARKAYEIFVSEGHPHGRDQEHWFRAEAELRSVLL